MKLSKGLPIAIILLALSLTTAFGQTKPTESQAFAFLESTLKLLKGKRIYTTDETVILTYVKWTDNSLAIKGEYKKSQLDLQKVMDVITDIPWHTYESMDIDTESGIKNVDLVMLEIKFSSNLKTERTINGVAEKADYDYSLSVIILKNKLESVKKAVLRLVEIYKEKNKDPFEN